MPTAPMVAIDRTTGNIVEIGDTVTNFRGETGVLQAITRGAVPGKAGKISIVDQPGESYDRVWNLKIVSMLMCGCSISEEGWPTHYTSCLRP